MSSDEKSRPIVEIEPTKSDSSNEKGIGNVVASHYNNIQERGKAARSESRIFHLRNFNNWIKSTLIKEYSNKVKDSKKKSGSDDQFNVLDLGCGKGGDLLKWDEAGIDNLVCVDIADVSVTVDARERYQQMLRRRRHNNKPPYKADFIAADVTKVRLKDVYPRKDLMFDIVSCQFAFHYCFESLDQAECMLRNASESLKPGGYFIATLPNSADLLARVRAAGSNHVGNSVYSVTFDAEQLSKHNSGEAPLPLFGAKYLFHLEGVVDCPEFLVHFDTLTRLAERFKLTLISKVRFESFFNTHKDKYKDLLINMKTLEPFPPRSGDTLKGVDVDDNYLAAKGYMDQNPEAGTVGTMSKEEWEALTLYQIFAFKKSSS